MWGGGLYDEGFRLADDLGPGRVGDSAMTHDSKWKIRAARFCRSGAVGLGFALGLGLAAGCVRIYNLHPQAVADRMQPDLAAWLGDGEGGGHFYQAVAAPEGVTWAEAQAWAVAHGGYLVTIGSAAENAFVFRLVDAPEFWLHDASESLGPWLGAYRTGDAADPSDGWRWFKGDAPLTYRNWAPGQPNNWDHNETRAHFWAIRTTAERLATWNDVRASILLHGFVVEYDARPKAY